MRSTLARPARIGPHHCRHRDAHPRHPELLVRPPVEDRDDDRGQLQVSGAGRGPGRGRARTGAGRGAHRGRRGMRVHEVDRPRQLVLLRVWCRPRQAALQRGRPGGRELLGGHRQRLQPPRARVRSRTRAAAGRRPAATRTRRRSSRPGGRRRTGRDGPGCGRFSGSTTPGSTSARTRARTIRPATATSRRTGTGTRTIVPADPNEYPGGPAAYDDAAPAPARVLCDRSDPPWETPAAARLARATATRIRAANGWSSRATGARRTATAAGETYQGYFDCALTDALCSAPSVAASGRPACVKAADSRAGQTTCRSHCARLVRGRRRDGHGVHRRLAASTPTTARAGTGVIVYVMRGTPAPWTNTGCCDFTIQSPRPSTGPWSSKGTGSRDAAARAATS